MLALRDLFPFVRHVRNEPLPPLHSRNFYPLNRLNSTLVGRGDMLTRDTLGHRVEARSAASKITGEVSIMKGQTHIRPSLSMSNPSTFLRDMVGEDSNHELDWLWAAGQVTAAEEIRYCLERALYVNPNNRDTQRALSKFVARPVTTNESQWVNDPSLAQLNSDN